MQSFGVTVWCVKNNQIIVVSITLAASFCSEQPQVKTDAFTSCSGDMPSTLTGGGVESWIVFSFDFDSSSINGQSVSTFAHEECGFENVSEFKTFSGLNWVACERDFDRGRVGEFEGSSDAAERERPGAFWSDFQSIVTVKIDIID